MVYGGFHEGPGFGGPGFGGTAFGGPGFGRQGFGGPGFGGPGRPRFLKRAAFGTLALLLDGPADAAQIVQRTSDLTDAALTPPQEVVEMAIGMLAGRGLVTVDNGVATLTELGRNKLAWKGVSSETAHAFFGRAAKFGDVMKIRWGLHELAGLARRIMWAGTDEQKAKLAEARSTVLAAITEANKSLHRALAEG
jgi:hypothetical protein